MSRGPAASSWVAVATILLALLGPGPFADTDRSAPMTDEDVVRRFVAGRSTEALLAEIDDREPDFDVSPEMLDELRATGLPAAVIEAMVRRQQTVEARNPPDEPSEPDDERSTLRIRIAPDKPANKRPVLELAEAIDPPLAVEWRLGPAPGDRVFSDIAIYLACTAPDHVPDHWRSRSPLGRDFVSMPRHRIVAFAAGARRVGKKAKARRVLEIPSVIEADLEPAVAHDLLLGVAVRAGDRYRRVIDDALPGLILEDRELDLVAVVEQRRGTAAFGFKVRFEGVPDDTADETPDPVAP